MILFIQRLIILKKELLCHIQTWENDIKPKEFRWDRLILLINN